MVHTAQGIFQLCLDLLINYSEMDDSQRIAIAQCLVMTGTGMANGKVPKFDDMLSGKVVLNQYGSHCLEISLDSHDADSLFELYENNETEMRAWMRELKIQAILGKARVGTGDINKPQVIISQPNADGDNVVKTEEAKSVIKEPETPAVEEKANPNLNAMLSDFIKQAKNALE